jgi:hypothetical protein
MGLFQIGTLINLIAVLFALYAVVALGRIWLYSKKQTMFQEEILYLLRNAVENKYSKK